MRLCHRDGVPFVARGHGTGLSGGALPLAGGVVIGLARLNRVLDVDIPNRRVTVEPGVTNLEITRQVAPFGYYYAPDPSSQQVCSIGGNVAENSGGAHCLKYGFTVHHVLGVEAVLPDGELVHIGSAMVDAPGPDLLGAARRIRRHARRRHEGHRADPAKPESVQTLLAAFDSIDAGGRRGIRDHRRRHHPGGRRDDGRARHRAAEAAVHPNFPPPTPILIVELDGPAAEVRALFAVVEDDRAAARARRPIEIAPDDQQRARIWKGRKAAFAAMGRVSPNYYVQDGVVPRTKLPEVLGRIRELEARSGLRIGNVFHAGDGNLHPLICYDERIPGQSDLADEVGGRDSAVLHRRRRIDHRRTRVGADKARLHAEDVHRRTTSTRCSRSAARSIQRICATRARSFRRRGSAAKFPDRIAQHPIEKAGLARTVLMQVTESIDGVAPRQIIEPASAEELALALASASSQRASVVIRGGGTKIGWGRTPSAVDILLSTKRLSALAAHEHADLTATYRRACASMTSIERWRGTGNGCQSNRRSTRRQ